MLSKRISQRGTPPFLAALLPSDSVDRPQLERERLWAANQAAAFLTPWRGVGAALSARRDAPDVRPGSRDRLALSRRETRRRPYTR